MFNAVYTLERLIEEDRISLHDVEALRLILTGGSIIDWRRLNFRSDDEIRSFLLTNEYDTADRFDQERLLNLYNRALTFLTRNLGLEIPEQLLKARDIFLPFRLASQWRQRSVLQLSACMLLKVMYVINYIDGRDLTNRLPLSSSEISSTVSRKIISELTQMAQRGLSLCSFSGGFKPRDSIITKLLLRSENLAMPIFDRIRFRLITQQRDQLVPLLHYFMKYFLPFNYVVPGESSNKLIDLQALLRGNPRLSMYLPLLQGGKEFEQIPMHENLYSDQRYKGINFISDIPLRIDRYLPDLNYEFDSAQGRIIFVLVEFQVLDQESHLQNEQGDSSHQNYKERQKVGVLHHLGALPDPDN